jgi:DNA-binding response OmpR family regulator
MARILVVEDEPTIAMGLQDDLQLEGHAIDVVSDGVAAEAAALERRHDLILLDVMLPQRDGFSVCRTVRAAGVRTPIILLTAKGQEVDKVLGLELGADDYVTKPFSPRELIARIKAHLRRVQAYTQASQQDVLQIGEIAMNVPSRAARLRGHDVQLPPKEFDLLHVFMANPDRVLGRDYLLDRVWGEDYVGDVRTLDVHIRWLREKIERDPSAPTHILTVHGVGYRFR